MRLREEVDVEFEFEFEEIVVVLAVVSSITDCSFFRRLFTILPSSMLELLLVLLLLLLVAVVVDFNFSLFPGIPQSSQEVELPSSCS